MVVSGQTLMLKKKEFLWSFILIYIPLKRQKTSNHESTKEKNSYAFRFRPGCHRSNLQKTMPYNLWLSPSLIYKSCWLKSFVIRVKYNKQLHNHSIICLSLIINKKRYTQKTKLFMIFINVNYNSRYIQSWVSSSKYVT